MRDQNKRVFRAKTAGRELLSRDKYGRLLAYVFRQSDNLLVNKEIIRQGYGHGLHEVSFRPRQNGRIQAGRESRNATQKGPLGNRTH